jgi:hypothetical protein
MPMYNLHRSPDGKEVVIFNKDQILPKYLVHFK